LFQLEEVLEELVKVLALVIFEDLLELLTLL
jgi:hypothetical protein